MTTPTRRRAAFAALLMAGLAAAGTLDPAAAQPPQPSTDDFTGFAEGVAPLVVGEEAAMGHLALVTVSAPGADAEVRLPVPETLDFDLSVDLPYLSGDADLGAEPAAMLRVANAAGLRRDIEGYVNLHEDVGGGPAGTVELYFTGVPYVRAGSYTLRMSWDSSVYAFDPTDVTAFELTVTDSGVFASRLEPLCETLLGCPESSASTGDAMGPGPDGADQASGTRQPSSVDSSSQAYKANGGSGGCRTYVGNTVRNAAAMWDDDVDQGNVWKNYTRVDFNVDTTWYGNCNKAGPGSYWAGNGYGATVRGPNNPPKGGPFLVDWSLSHKGGGTGTASPDGFGSKTIHAQPELRFHRPTDIGKVRLENTIVLGLNKNSCTSWPAPVAEALEVLSWFVESFTWSVVVSFATREYCSSNYNKLDAGPANDRNLIGVHITKASGDTQYEHAGRFSVFAQNAGSVSLPFTYRENVYGTVTAHGNPTTNFNVWTPPFTTQSPPKIRVA